MWHKPQLMTVIADLLFAAAAAALLVAGALGAARLPLFPLKEVVFVQELKEVQRSDVERALSGLVRGNFFSVNLESLRQSLEKLSWVRKAEVRRKWPGRLEVSVEEHQVAARWGEGASQLVNGYGEVFNASLPQDRLDALPLLAGPAGTAPEVLRRFAELAQVISPTGRQPRQLLLSPRLAWQVRLDDGMVLELGREQPKAPIAQRLERFVDIYPTVLATRTPRPAAVDLRYPNGFALRLAAAGK
ncbi:MAG: cell division protein FtsQ/DivIB [Betaproteobacteria bacterium]|nr:cell division protein FtsQ/DivIB [Betaproteobacteria bacterium]